MPASRCWMGPVITCPAARRRGSPPLSPSSLARSTATAQPPDLPHGSVHGGAGAVPESAAPACPVGGDRFPVVDDRLRVAPPPPGGRIRVVDHRGLKPGKLGHVPADVLAARVETPALQGGVEHA